MKKKFISIIWWYHKQIFTFEKHQNYHMMPFEAMIWEWYDCEIFSIDSKVKIESDPNFVNGVKVIYYKNILEYLLYLFKNRQSIIYSNSLTLKTLLVWILWKKTIFMAHDQVLPQKNKKFKKLVVLFFYNFFWLIRVINKAEKIILDKKWIKSFVLPISISKFFLSQDNKHRNWWIFVWNLYHDKNPEFLIETCKILQSKNIKFTINIVWEDRYNKNWETFKCLIKKNNLENYIKVLWFLSHKQLKQKLKESLIFINTSLSEWQCLAVYEWALSGNSLCLQDILSFPSVFQKNALYHNNPKELSSNIIYFLNNTLNRKKMIRNNQNMILNKYDYEKNKNTFKEIVLNLIK